MNCNPEAIFDIHVHYLDNRELDREFMEFARNWNMPFAVSCLGPDGSMLVNPTIDEVRRANDHVIRLRDENPELVHSFCYLNPLHGQQALDEMERCVSTHGMAGVKLWIACKCSDEKVYPIIEKAIDLRIPVLQHAWMRVEGNLPGESSPYDIAQLAERYPEAKMIMAHIGFRWKYGVDAVKDHTNVLVDTSGFDPEMGSIEYAVEQLGVNRVIYGSDAPGRDVLCQIGKVLGAELSEEDRNKILHLNAESLLGRSR